MGAFSMDGLADLEGLNEMMKIDDMDDLEDFDAARILRSIKTTVCP